MSVEEAKALADNLVDGQRALSPETLKHVPALVNESADYEPFSPLDTTAAMGAQLSARLDVLNAEIAELFLKLEILCGDADFFDALQQAQAAWVTFRDAEGYAAAVEMAGGTGRMVNSLSVEISVTEDRIDVLKKMVEEQKHR